MGAPTSTPSKSSTMNAPPASPSPGKSGVFHKLFPKRGSRKQASNVNNSNNNKKKKKHAEPLKVASAMPPPSTTTPTPQKKSGFWHGGSFGTYRNSSSSHGTTPPRPLRTSNNNNNNNTTPESAARRDNNGKASKKTQQPQQALQSIPPVLEGGNSPPLDHSSSTTNRTGSSGVMPHPSETEDATATSTGDQLLLARDDNNEDEEGETAAHFLLASDAHHHDQQQQHGYYCFGDGDNSTTIMPLELSLSAQKRLVKERDGFCRRVNRYDGSVIHVEGVASYELGNYLGGGVAGVVYEGQRLLPESAYPVRRGKEQPTPDIVVGTTIIGVPRPQPPASSTNNNNPSSSILDYVTVPCSGGGVFGTATTNNNTTNLEQSPHHPYGNNNALLSSTTSCLAPTTVISIPPHHPALMSDLHRCEGSMLTTESFANHTVSVGGGGGGARSVAGGNSVALEAVIDDVIMIDDIDAPSRSKQMAESLRQNSSSVAGGGNGGGGNGCGGGMAVHASFQEVFMEEKVAIKILNPVGFRALATEVTETAVVARPGTTMSRDVRNGRRPMTEDHVWWLVNPSSRNLRTLQKYPDAASTPRGVEVDRGQADRGLRISLIAAFKDPKTNQLKELPLNRCIEIWGHIPFETSDAEFRRIMHSIDQINQGLPPPALPTTDRVTTATTTSMDDGSTVVGDNDVVMSSSSPVKNNNNNNNFFKPPPSPLMSKRTGILKAASTPRKTAYCAELNAYIAIPSVPSKFLKWLRQRRAATKEIRNMMLIGRHRNVVHLFEVLELIQETKSTMFLVLELVQGGELFDLISSNTARIPPVDRIPEGFTAAETAMRKFFVELASGILYCHANHIAHRDLKPENLLVHNNDDGSCTLKIADFGLSAVFSADVDGNNDSDTATLSSHLSTPPILAKQQQQQQQQRAVVTPTPLQQQQQQQPISPIKQQMDKLLLAGGAALGFFTCGAVDNIIDCTAAGETGGLKTFALQQPVQFKRMTSVVGSPHYVAPEIISQQDRRKKMEAGQEPKRRGYDGTRADVWSAGVILYAMLFRSLPFGEDLLRCPRYQSFKKWYDDIKTSSSARSRRRDLYAALNPVITETDARELLGPQWFFPTDSSPEARDLVIYMLNPDPDQRPSIELVLQHPWLLKDAMM